MHCLLIVTISYLFVGLSARSSGQTQQWTVEVEEEFKNQLRHSVPARVASRLRRAATARLERLWDYGVIPYEIESNFSGECCPLLWLDLFQNLDCPLKDYCCEPNKTFAPFP